jgi:hypothetical protein
MNQIPQTSVSFAAAEILDLDGIKTTIASSASPATYVAANFNGAEVAGSGVRFAKSLVARSVTVSRSNSPGSYTTAAIVVTGTYGGATVTENLTPLNANGNDLIQGTMLYDAPPTFAFPAQVNGSGAFTLGVQDIGKRGDGPEIVAVKTHAAGYVRTAGLGGYVDAMPTAAHVVEILKVSRLHTNPSLTNPTTVGLTVYLG